jgi:hypothetical protein
VADPTSGREGPTYTIDHLRCLSILLALPSTNQGATLASRSNFAAIFRSGIPDTTTKQQVTKLLGDLHGTWCRRVMHLPNGSSEELHFKILDAFNIRTRRQAGQILWRQWEALRINPHFHALVDGMARAGKGKSIPIFLPAFLSLSSDLAAKLYLYLAGPAFHHQANHPFKITTGATWQRLNLPESRFASVRKKLLVQNKNSVIQQIDGALLSRGRHRLRVTLEPTTEGNDYNVIAWAESIDTSNDQTAVRPVSKFKEAWQRSGRSEGDFRNSLNPPQEIDEHDRELLDKAGINPQPCLSALRIAKSLLPSYKWDELIAEAKSDGLENHLRPYAERTRDPVRLLMYRLIEAVAAPP